MKNQISKLISKYENLNNQKQAVYDQDIYYYPDFEPEHLAPSDKKKIKEIEQEQSNLVSEFFEENKKDFYIYDVKEILITNDLAKKSDFTQNLNKFFNKYWTIRNCTSDDKRLIHIACNDNNDCVLFVIDNATNKELKDILTFEKIVELVDKYNLDCFNYDIKKLYINIDELAQRIFEYEKIGCDDVDDDLLRHNAREDAESFEYSLPTHLRSHEREQALEYLYKLLSQNIYNYSFNIALISNFTIED